MYRHSLFALLVVTACGTPEAPVGAAADADSGREASTAGETIDEVGMGDAQPRTQPDADTVSPGGVAWPESSCVVFDERAEDPTESLFAPNCVVDVDLQLAPTDWEELRGQTRTVVDVLAGDCMAGPPSDIFTWFEADVSIGGVTVERIGLRKKGFLGSLSTTKPSLKLRFDKFVDGQRLSGMKRLTLNNMNQDPGLTTSCLAYDLLRRAGIPAPRCNFARVRVNGLDLGIYAHVESIKSAFLERHFASSDGNLYEGTVSDFRPGFLATFDKKNNETLDDWTDLDAAVTALEADDEELITAVSAIFDLDEFLTFWAMEVLIAHWDGYAGNTNNFYIYRDFVGGDGKFHFIPWGIDSAFQKAPELAGEDVFIPESVLAFGFLAHRLYQWPPSRQLYHQRLLELLETVWDGASLAAEVERMRTLLLPHLSAQQAATFNAKNDFRKSWVMSRKQQLLSELQPVAPDWELGPRQTICWPKAGVVSGAFVTSWGSAGFDPLSSSGEVTTDIEDIGVLGNVSCTARIGTADGQVGEAVVEIIAQGSDNLFFLTRLIGPVSALAPNTSHPIDFLTFRGYLGYFIPLENTFSAFGLLHQGVLSFEAATLQPGQLISGSFSADVILAPL